MSACNADEYRYLAVATAGCIHTDVLEVQKESGAASAALVAEKPVAHLTIGVAWIHEKCLRRHKPVDVVR